MTGDEVLIRREADQVDPRWQAVGVEGQPVDTCRQRAVSEDSDLATQQVVEGEVDLGRLVESDLDRARPAGRNRVREGCEPEVQLANPFFAWGAQRVGFVPRLGHDERVVTGGRVLVDEGDNAEATSQFREANL